MANGDKYREVTVGMRGEVPDEEALAIIEAAGAQLSWGDNGFLNYISAPTTLKLPEGVRGRAFNLMPLGLNKRRGVERFCELRGIDREETLSIWRRVFRFPHGGRHGAVLLGRERLHEGPRRTGVPGGPRERVRDGRPLSLPVGSTL